MFWLKGGGVYFKPFGTNYVHCGKTKTLVLQSQVKEGTLVPLKKKVPSRVSFCMLWVEIIYM